MQDILENMQYLHIVQICRCMPHKEWHATQRSRECMHNSDPLELVMEALVDCPIHYAK